MSEEHRISRRSFSSLLMAGGVASLVPASLVPPSFPNALSGELVAAVTSGDLSTVVRILDQDPKLKSHRDGEGRSIFVLAHLHAQTKVADEILNRGIELDVVEAVLANDKDRFIELVKAAPDSVNAIHPIGGNAYYAAAVCGKEEMIWPLNRWGASPNVRDDDSTDVTAFRAAFRHSDEQTAVQLGMRILIDAGDVNAQQPGNNSVLHGAAALGDPELVAAVIRRGGKVDLKNSDDATPLDVATRMGNDAAAGVLREHERIRRMDRTSRFVQDANGEAYSPPQELNVPQLVINEFCEMCHYDFARSQQILKDYPLVIHGNASWDELGVEACAHMERADWTKYFLERGAPMSLTTALAVADLESARSLLKQNKDRITERGPHDFPIMWYPQIGGGGVDLAELLLQFGAEIDEHKFGVTCLHKAAYNGQRDLVAFLIENDANVNLVGRSDFSNLSGTPLDWAQARNQTQTARLLKDNGGKSKNEINHNGN